jgi:fatty acid desaturase
MKIVDPTTAATPFYASWIRPLIVDPRDAETVGLVVECLLICAVGVGMFFSGPWLWYAAPLYWLLLAAGRLDRFTLMLHCTSHRQLFKPRHAALNLVIPWVIGPFFGQTPETYFAHHMGMHHVEENLPKDLSSTMKYQRDRMDHWVRYWFRFMTIGLPSLMGYLVRRKRARLIRRVILGEGLYWTAMAVLLYLRPGPTLVVFLIPLVLIRSLMMAGNWGQHAFVAADAPENPYKASITCINSRYNRRCFNDGYHIGHHLQARAHWTELPVEFEKNIAEYAKNDAIVFEGLDFFLVWVLLMTRRFSTLSKAFVRLPGAPERTDAEVEAFLKERLRPFAAEPAPAPQTVSSAPVAG